MNPGNHGKNGMLGIVESVTYGPHSRGQGTTLSSSTTKTMVYDKNLRRRSHPKPARPRPVRTREAGSGEADVSLVTEIVS
jgi:hypothetical protein